MSTPLRSGAAAAALRFWFPEVAPPEWMGAFKSYLTLNSGWIALDAVGVWDDLYFLDLAGKARKAAAKAGLP